MMRALTALLWATACLACQAGLPKVQSHSYYDDATDFSKRRYAWLDARPTTEGETRAQDPRVHEAIRVAIDSVLAAKGFLLSPPAQADFLVTYHLAVREALATTTINREYYGDDWDFTEPRTRVTRYEKGRLVIDVSDAGSRRVVWRGDGQARLQEPPPPPDVARRNAYYAVTEILAEFPPPPASGP